MANIAYEVIRNPAEFVYDAESQAFYIIGDEDDYLGITVFAGDSPTGRAIEEEVFRQHDRMLGFFNLTTY